jgi:hypothetical protein
MVAQVGRGAHGQYCPFRSRPSFAPELVDTWRSLGDQVAERAVTLGAVPDGQAATVASFSQIAPLPAGHLRDYDVSRRPCDRSRGARASAHRNRSQPRPGFGGPLDRGHGHTRKAALDASGAAPARLRHGPQQPVAARGTAFDADLRQRSGTSARETVGCRSCEGWRWPRPAAGRVHDRGQSAHRHRPVWLAPWERSGQRCDVRRKCPRAQPLRKWVPTPIWSLGNASGMRRTCRPEPRMGFAWRRDGTQAVWAETARPSIMGAT